MAKLTRYSNSILPEGITFEAQEALINSKIVVIGAGAIGSNVIMNLSALGVGQLKIIDCEVVKEEDLNRQIIHKYKNIGRAKVISAKDWIQEFNTDIKVEIDKLKLNELNYFTNVLDYDIIVDCSNDTELNYLLNEISQRHNKILVYGAVKGFYGQATTIVPSKTGCLNCVMEKPSLNGNNTAKFATLPTTSTIIAGILSQEVLKIITNTGEPLLNRLLMYDGMLDEVKIVNYSKNPSCSVCCAKTAIL